MSTEFFAMQPPPGTSVLANYIRGKPNDEQPESIPDTFLEAMSVREAVFVHEQNIPLENELDDDDARSWHWVTYVSVGASSSKTSGPEKRGSTASRKPAATLRLVPPPHPPHPGSDDASTTAHPFQKTHSRTTSSGSIEDEQYICLGRLATLAPFRKLGLARLLVDNALAWAAEHADEIVPPVSATDREAARLEATEAEREAMSREVDRERWNGLVLVHAQKDVQKWYENRGFELDKSMGEWDEEGIPHVGMWKRIPLKARKQSVGTLMPSSTR